MSQIKPHEIDPHCLPIVPCMVHPAEIDGIEFTLFSLEELKNRSSMDISARWALQTITELQRMWFETTDKLMAIDEIISKRNYEFNEGKQP